MAITVSDIEQKEFAYKGAGYDPYDVDQYLDQICDEMVAMQDRVAQLEAELAKAKRETELAVRAAKPAEVEVVKAPVAPATQTLESILTNAQRLADGAVEDARHKASMIVKEAQDKASAILANTGDEKDMLEKSVKALRISAKEFQAKFSAMLDEQKELMDSNASLFEDGKD
jgi:cell division initiation protein